MPQPNLSRSYKNPANTPSNRDIKVAINSTTLGNSDKRLTENIPQTKASI
ncbi:unnamed protein product, partial [Tuber aestivum]